MLHEAVKASVLPGSVIAKRCASGLRVLLESGTAEGFLRDLLVLELATRGHRVTRERPVRGLKRGYVDLVVEDSPRTYVEAKQLHLKDRDRCVKNVAADLHRHGARQVARLGLVYLLDERRSQADMAFARFGGANRRATFGVDDMALTLRRTFPTVWPTTTGEALLRRFRGAGAVDLYAFVVTSPKRGSA
jgi:hypothetical protein